MQAVNAATRFDPPEGGGPGTEHGDAKHRREMRPLITTTPGLPPTGRSETIVGYVEWQRGGYLIADGERVRWTAKTRLKLAGVTSPQAIPLGYELKATGHRSGDGFLIANVLEAKPNGVAAYERDVYQATNALEAKWMAEGAVFDLDQHGARHTIGRIVQSGPQVKRVQHILGRLVPPSVRAASLRVNVVQTNLWNASAMGNGAIWVYEGLLDDLSDDELAAVLGHELAHYTHEHTRRLARNSVLLGLANWGRRSRTRPVRRSESEPLAGPLFYAH
jgi:hypothetical protein